MLFLPRYPKLKQFLPFPLALAALIFIFAFLPPAQSGDPGVQGNAFENATITTTAQTALVACSQGSGAIGRKTLVVENSNTSAGAITVTAELRTATDAPNFTSGYLAVGGVATNTASSDTSLPTEAAGRYCQISATSASTSVVTITLRRE